MDTMSKEKIIKALKITTTVILPLTITLASILFGQRWFMTPNGSFYTRSTLSQHVSKAQG